MIDFYRSGTGAEIWSPTLGLRVKYFSPHSSKIQQAWQSNTGKIEWRELPVVNWDEPDAASSKASRPFDTKEPSVK